MEKIIFLDIDGVLNTGQYHNYLICQNKPSQDKYGMLFDPKAVRQLKRIVEATRADIIIDSSWKFLGLEVMQEMWKQRNLPGKVIGVTDSVATDNWLLKSNLDDIDPTLGHCKGMEIASWLDDNTKNDVNYVILDDEYVCLESQIPYFVLTNSNYGITEDIADKVIAILNFSSFDNV